MMDNDSLLFSECLLTSEVQFDQAGDYNRLGWADQEADREVAILFKERFFNDFRFLVFSCEEHPLKRTI